MKAPKPLLGGVELGGTKCVCLIGTGPDDIRAQISIPTGCDADLTPRRILIGLGSLAGPLGALALARRFDLIAHPA
jgi:hypothetical protein